MQLLEALLSLENKESTKTKSKNNPNFLLELLKNSKDKDLKEIIKAFNIKEEDLKNIKDKKLKEKILLEIKSIKQKNNKISPSLDITNHNIDTQNKKFEKDYKQKNKQIDKTITIEDIRNTPLIMQIKKEEVVIIKNKIKKLPQFNSLSLQLKKEFEKIKTFKELISFANKNNLNIKEIKIAIPKETSSNINFNIPSKKIEIKNLSKNYKQAIKIEPNIHTNIQNKKSKITLASLLNKTTKKEDKEDKMPLKNQIYTQTIQPQPNNNPVIELKQNILKAKETIKNFSNKLKEAITNYKPPITKIDIDLHPKELGKIALTITKKGKNLKININSNNNAINIFNIHQNELKQQLNNIGFNEINMSFNSNNQKQNENKNQSKQYKKYEEDEEELIIEIPNYA
jgi:hypothetical protein